MWFNTRGIPPVGKNGRSVCFCAVTASKSEVKHKEYQQRLESRAIWNSLSYLLKGTSECCYMFKCMLIWTIYMWSDGDSIQCCGRNFCGCSLAIITKEDATRPTPHLIHYNKSTIWVTKRVRWVTPSETQDLLLLDCSKNSIINCRLVGWLVGWEIRFRHSV